MTPDPSTAPDLAALCRRLRSRAAALRARPIGEWRELWERVRREYASEIERHLAQVAGRVDMAPPTLDASVGALLAGLDPESLSGSPREEAGVTLVILAASVPALAAQSLFPLLVSGSAVIFKPSSREPDTARLLVDVLGRLDAEAAAAVTLSPDPRFGGDGVDTSGLDRVVAYGHDETVASIADSLRRSGGSTAFSPQGHGWSAAYLAAESITDELLGAVARDVALFDQRGCLCPQVVLTSAPAAEVVEGLGEALARIANELPPTPDAVTSRTRKLGALRQLRDAAVAGGRTVSDQPLATGLVVEADAEQPVTGTPGGRSVRVRGDVTGERAIELLRPAASRLQSVAVAAPGDLERHLRAEFADLGVSRVTAPGALHRPGFDWVARQLGLGARPPDQ